MPTVPRRLGDITPEWMTAALAAAFPGVEVGSAEVGPVAYGTNARARVRLQYARGGGPAWVFVKGPGRPANRLALAALGAYATEARLARSSVELAVRHPAFYAGSVDRTRLAGVVVMDDVTAAGGRPNDGVEALSVDEVRDGLAGLAGLHGRYLGRPLPAGVGFLRPWRLGAGWSAVSVANLVLARRKFRAIAPGVALSPQVTMPALGRQFARWAHLAASGDQTLLHGDPHPANTYAVDGARTGFFDWQLARTGHWSHDVGYFLVGSLCAADRRVHERSLFEGYLDALAAAGGTPQDPTESWDRYRASPAFGLATWLHTLSFGSFQPPDLCVAMVTRYATAYCDLETATSPLWR